MKLSQEILIQLLIISHNSESIMTQCQMSLLYSREPTQKQSCNFGITNLEVINYYLLMELTSQSQLEVIDCRLT